MKKKWPLNFQRHTTTRDFRLERKYGIEILKEEDKQFRKLNWSGAIKIRRHTY